VLGQVASGFLRVPLELFFGGSDLISCESLTSDGERPVHSRLRSSSSSSLIGVVCRRSHWAIASSSIRSVSSSRSKVSSVEQSAALSRFLRDHDRSHHETAEIECAKLDCGAARN
jgi:hypothetical protein